MFPVGKNPVDILAFKIDNILICLMNLIGFVVAGGKFAAESVPT